MAEGNLVTTGSGDLRDLPVEQRLVVYQGIAAAAIFDVRTVSDQELRLLSYGRFRDREAWEAIGGEENMWAATDPVFQAVHDQADDGGMYELLYATGKTKQEKLDAMTPDQRKYYESEGALLQGDRLEQEGLAIPLTMAAVIVGYFGGAAIAGTTTPLAAGYTAAAGTKGGTAALAVASQITGASARGILWTAAKYTSGAVGIVGAPALGFGIWDYSNNPEKYADEIQYAELTQEVGKQQEANKIAQLAATGTWEERAQAWAERSDIRGWMEGMEAQGEFMQPYFEARDAGTLGDSNEEVAAKQTAADSSIEQGMKTSDLTYTREQGIAAGEAAGVTGTGAVDYDPNNPNPPGAVDTPNLDNPYVGGLREGYQALVRRGVLRGPDEIHDKMAQTRKEDVWVDPRYRQTDMELLMATLTEADIIKYQEELVRAGRIGETKVSGLMDTLTVNQLEATLYEANVEGLDWRFMSAKSAAAGDRARASDEEQAKKNALEALGPFRRNTYLEPDYDALSQASDDAVSRQLGRKINDWEQAYLIDVQQDAARAKFDQSEGLRRQQFDDSVRIIEDDLDWEDTIGGGTVQDIDPAAKFRSAFESTFKNEIDRKGRTIEAEDRSNTLMRGLNNAMGAIGGR